MKKTILPSLLAMVISSSALLATTPGDGVDGNNNSASSMPAHPDFNPDLYPGVIFYKFPSAENQQPGTIIAEPLKPVDMPPTPGDVAAAYKAFDDFVKTGACSLGDPGDPSEVRTPEKVLKTSLAFLNANELMNNYKMVLFVTGEDNVDYPSHYPNGNYMAAGLVPGAISSYIALENDTLNCDYSNPAAVLRIWMEMINCEDQLLVTRIGDFVADAQASPEFVELQKALSLQQELSQSGVAVNQAELLRIQDLIAQYDDRFYEALAKRAQFNDEELSAFYEAKAILSNARGTSESWPQFHDIALFESQLSLLEYANVILDNREFGVDMHQSSTFLNLQTELSYSDANNPNDLLWLRFDMMEYEKSLRPATIAPVPQT